MTSWAGLTIIYFVHSWFWKFKFKQPINIAFWEEDEMKNWKNTIPSEPFQKFNHKIAETEEKQYHKTMIYTRPKLKYCLFAVSRPTQKNLHNSKDFIAVFKIKKFIFPKFSFRSVPYFSKVPVSGIYRIFVVFP